MEKKNITNTVRALMVILNVGLFALVWFGYYNMFSFTESNQLVGGIVSCVMYGMIYLFLCHIYKSFRIASMQIGETVFSQLLCFGIADVLMYTEVCLVSNQLVNIVPGALIVLCQLVGTICMVICSKHYMVKHVPAQKTVIVYGKDISKEEISQFEKRLQKKYAHLFSIEKRVSEREIAFCMEDVISNTTTVLLYEVSPRTRKSVMKYTIALKKNLYFTPTIEDITLQGCTEKHLLDTPLMKYDYVYETASEYLGKRVFDIVFSGLLLLVASPFMLITAIAIKLEDGGPVFFKQKRCTKNGEAFEMIKFRSMIADADRNGFKPSTKNDDRITKVGHVIRKVRMDELPQLINILKGDMSVVGPRPEPVELTEEYAKELPEFVYRMRVKGGLTGYAQIYGKYNTTAYDKLKLDLMYIERQSFLLDLKMIMLTIKTVFTPESTEAFEEEESYSVDQIEIMESEVATR